MGVKDRFSEADGRRLLLEALLTHSLVGGSSVLANALADAGTVEEYPTGATLIRQDETDNHIFMILAGEVSILVNDREVARRAAGQHIGEMALIDVTARRSATVVARHPATVLQVSESAFSRIAKAEPLVWRRLAVELAWRLRQRNALVRARNEMPILFVGSSKETLPVAQAAQAGLAHDRVIVRLWTDGVFGPSRFPIDDLLEQVNQADFAVLVVGPDDKVLFRDDTVDTPRDNVVFELGLFMGGLGRERSVVVAPRGIPLKLPSDIFGLTTLEYDPAKLIDPAACLGPVCTALRERILRLGPR